MEFLQIPGNQRFTASGDLGRAGKPKRVYLVSMASEASTAGVLKLRDGTSTGGTEYIGFEGNAGSSNAYNLGKGIRFENGCYVHCGATSGVTYAVVVYHEEA